MKLETIGGREYRTVTTHRLDIGVVEVTKRVETLRSRAKRWIKANIIDDDPYDDESHAKTRYKGQP